MKNLCKITLLTSGLLLSGFAISDVNETTLYGSLSYDISIKDRSDLETNVVKWGIKGKEVISDNFNALYKLEFSGNGNGRYAWVGLENKKWGTIKFGRQTSLYYALSNYNDIFNNVFYGSNVYYDEGLRRPEKVIAYNSPSFSGLTFGASTILSSNGITDNYYNINNIGNVNANTANFQTGMAFDKYGFYTSLAYAKYKGDLAIVKDLGNLNYTRSNGSGNTELVSGTIGYRNDTFKVGANIQHKASDGNKGSLVGEYYFGPNTIRAGFGYSDSKDLKHTLNRDVKTYALGHQYNFSKRTYLYEEFEHINKNCDIIYEVRKCDSKNMNNFKIGVRHDF